MPTSLLYRFVPEKNPFASRLSMFGRRACAAIKIGSFESLGVKHTNTRCHCPVLNRSVNGHFIVLIIMSAQCPCPNTQTPISARPIKYFGDADLFRSMNTPRCVPSLCCPCACAPLTIVRYQCTHVFVLNSDIMFECLIESMAAIRPLLCHNIRRIRSFLLMSVSVAVCAAGLIHMGGHAFISSKFDFNTLDSHESAPSEDKHIVTALVDTLVPTSKRTATEIRWKNESLQAACVDSVQRPNDGDKKKPNDSQSRM